MTESRISSRLGREGEGLGGLIQGSSTDSSLLSSAMIPDPAIGPVNVSMFSASVSAFCSP